MILCQDGIIITFTDACDLLKWEQVATISTDPNNSHGLLIKDREGTLHDITFNSIKAAKDMQRKSVETWTTWAIEHLNGEVT